LSHSDGPTFGDAVDEINEIIGAANEALSESAGEG